MEGTLVFLIIVWIGCAGVFGFAIGHDGWNRAVSDARFAGKCEDAMHGKVTHADSQNLCVVNGKILFTAKR